MSVTSEASLKTLWALADFLYTQGADLQIFSRNSGYLSLEYLGCAVGDKCVILHQRGSLRSPLMYESLRWWGSPRFFFCSLWCKLSPAAIWSQSAPRLTLAPSLQVFHTMHVRLTAPLECIWSLERGSRPKPSAHWAVTGSSRGAINNSLWGKGLCCHWNTSFSVYTLTFSPNALHEGKPWRQTGIFLSWRKPQCLAHKTMKPIWTGFSLWESPSALPHGGAQHSTLLHSLLHRILKTWKIPVSRRVHHVQMSIWQCFLAWCPLSFCPHTNKEEQYTSFSMKLKVSIFHSAVSRGLNMLFNWNLRVFLAS